jgi:hypothetical protein
VANLLPRALAGRLHKWIEGGRYAALFDNVEDTLTVDRLQVFDFEAMRAYPSLLEPLLFYVLHRVTERIQAASELGTLKVCVMDEAWLYKGTGATPGGAGGSANLQAHQLSSFSLFAPLDHSMATQASAQITQQYNAIVSPALAAGSISDTGRTYQQLIAG